MSIATHAPITAPIAEPSNDQVSSGELRVALDDLAYDIAENGTESRRPLLEMLAEATRRVVPGAAAALVDWAGTEVARLRAFSVVHHTVRFETDDEERDLSDPGVPPAVFYRLVA